MGDVVVVGAGLGGLSAAVAAAQAGQQVVVLEALERAGGLCGSWQWQGHAVPRACEEFGQTLFDGLAALGCPVEHRPSRGRLVGGARGGWLSGLPVLYRALVSRTVGEVIGADEQAPLARELASMTALAGTPPANLPMAPFRRRASDWRTGLRRRPVSPLGPQALTDALVGALEAAGGTLRLGCPVQSMEETPAGVVVQTASGAVTGDVLVRCIPDWSAWPSDTVSSLALCQVLFLLDGDEGLPDGLDVLHVHPRPTGRWMASLDAGVWPEGGPGLSLFAVPAQVPGRRVVGCYVCCPRGEQRWTDPQRRVDALLARIEAELPGFSARVLEHEVVDPERFRALHGLRPVSVGRMCPPGFTPPPAVRGRSFHVNASVTPVVDHADAAVNYGRRMGRRAAEVA